MQKRDFFALSAICTLQFFILYVNVNDSALKKTVQLLSCMKKKL
jgi:hypothetical protein